MLNTKREIIKLRNYSLKWRTVSKPSGSNRPSKRRFLLIFTRKSASNRCCIQKKNRITAVFIFDFERYMVLWVSVASLCFYVHLYLCCFPFYDSLHIDSKGQFVRWFCSYNVMFPVLDTFKLSMCVIRINFSKRHN